MVNIIYFLEADTPSEVKSPPAEKKDENGSKSPKQTAPPKDVKVKSPAAEDPEVTPMEVDADPPPKDTKEVKEKETAGNGAAKEKEASSKESSGSPSPADTKTE